MTEEEARLYLPIQDFDELEDMCEERLFEHKQFFIARVPVTKLYSGRIKQLNNLHEAYKVLGGDVSDGVTTSIDLQEYKGDDIADLVMDFQKNTSALKQGVVQSGSFKELIEVVRLQLSNMRAYADAWKIDIAEETGDVKVTVPEDEVELLMELEAKNNTERLKVKDILKLDKKSRVYREAIRLSLWRKLEENV